MSGTGVVGSQYLPDCSRIRWDENSMAYWCTDTGKTVSHMNGYTGICNNCCAHNTEPPETLEERDKKIRQIDETLNKLHDELRSLYYVGLSTEKRNKLWDMVRSDHKPHWT